MKLTDYFNVLLKDTVNLGQVKLDLLDSRVESVYKALKADDQIGSLIQGKTPRVHGLTGPSSAPSATTSSMRLHAQREREPDWADDPKQYIEAVYAALHRHAPAGTCRTTEVSRSARLHDVHLDIVPHLNLAADARSS